MSVDVRKVSADHYLDCDICGRLMRLSGHAEESGGYIAMLAGQHAEENPGHTVTWHSEVFIQWSSPVAQQ